MNVVPTDPNTPIAGKLLRVSDVAERLGVSTRQIWRLVATFGLPEPITVGRRSKRWRPADIESYIKSLAK